MIPGLDGLRAIAFLAVFFYHARYFHFGWAGVQLFFVLSGFLITGILLNMKETLSKRDYFIKFYARRFLRIFPLYYFYLLLMGIVSAWLISINYRPSWMEPFASQVKYAVVYAYNFLLATANIDSSFALEHLWSLSVEEQFYIFWPLFIFLIPQKSQKGVFLFLIGLAPIFRLSYYLLYTHGFFSNFHPGAIESLHQLPFTYMDAFAMGAYISRYNIPKAKEQFIPFLVLIPLAGFTAQYLATGEIGAFSTFGFPAVMSAGYQFIWGYSLLNYFFAITIQSVAREAMFNRFLEWAPMRYLGKISYGLYVFHQPVIWFAFDIQEFITMDKNYVKPVATVIAFTGTILLAAISYHIMEKPILGLKDRFFAIKQRLSFS